MSDRFELFISYSRKDDEDGWVTGLRDFILADHRRFSSEPMRVFLDRSEIHGMDDWRHRILGALRSSSVLLVCQSPNYYHSTYCKWEFEEYLRLQARVPVGGDPIAVVYFVEVKGSDSGVDARWRAEVTRHHHIDLQPWFPQGTEALQEADVAARLGELGERVWDRLAKVRRAEAVIGNLRRPSATFVGRHAEMRRLHEQVALGQVGVVTALHGLGGLGKTELAVAYANAFADHYRGGAWSLAAEGKSDLLALVGELSVAPELGYTRTPAEEADPRLAGRGVLAHLARLATTGPDSHDSDAAGTHALLILDNVDDPGLLSAQQVGRLPSRDVVRVVATTRLGADRLTHKGGLAFVPVDVLAPDDALELIRWHQPPRDPDGLVPDFISGGEEDAAREIVALLGGFTLAVEQVAVYLGINPDVPPSAYLSWLRSQGLGLTDRRVDGSVREALHHEEGLLSVVLSSQLGTLDEVERFVLRAAAWLPSDEIPWPWLETIARTQFHRLTVTEDKDPWPPARRRLEGLRFLTPGEHHTTARLHRMVAAHLKASDDSAAAADAVAAFLAARGRAITKGEPAPAWECAVFAHAALAMVRSHPAIIPDVGNTLPTLARYVVDGSVEQLADYLLAHHRDLAAKMPGNLAARDVSFSLNNVARLRQRTDPGAALTLYEESLTIRRDMAEKMSGNLDAARDVSVSLNNVADLRQRTDPGAALTLYEESLTIRRELAAKMPGNLDAARDVSFSLINVARLRQRTDPGAALTLYEESLTIARELAEKMPGNLDAQADLVVGLYRLASLLDEAAASLSTVDDAVARATRYWTEACTLLRTLDVQGHLPPGWDQFLQIACEKSSR